MDVGIVNPSIRVGAFFPPQWKRGWCLNWRIPGCLFGDVVEVIHSPVRIECTAPSGREGLRELNLRLGYKLGDIRNSGNIGIQVVEAGCVVLDSLHWNIWRHNLGVWCCYIRPSYRLSRRNGFSGDLWSWLRRVAVRNRIDSPGLVCAYGVSDTSSRMAGRLVLHLLDRLQVPNAKTDCPSEGI